MKRAVVTHAHADHARWGSRTYLTTIKGAWVLRPRMQRGARIDTVAYGESLKIGSARVSLHPAGHLLGSAQVRVEVKGQVAVVSGDYKTQHDRTCESFEPVPCNLFITECTFGLPVYKWRPQAEVFDSVNRWWRQNAEEGRTSIIYAYALGKAQRVLGGIDPSIGPILVHGAVDKLTKAYRAAGIDLPPTLYASPEAAREHRGKALVVAPPSVNGTPWLRKFGDVSRAFASGWMHVRGMRRRRAVDRGFVISDHADWPGLLESVEATGAEEIWATHGHTRTFSRYLQEQGYNTREISTRFEGEQESDSESEE